MSFVYERRVFSVTRLERLQSSSRNYRENRIYRVLWITSQDKVFFMPRKSALFTRIRKLYVFEVSTGMDGLWSFLSWGHLVRLCKNPVGSISASLLSYVWMSSSFQRGLTIGGVAIVKNTTFSRNIEF